MVLRRLPPIRPGAARRGNPMPANCDDLVAVQDLVADNQYSAPRGNSNANPRATRPDPLKLTPPPSGEIR